ncbi:alpha-tocopherol transfer protein-like [Galleria mellonella]|uniref:Alpha-tocopherol transfer protein-like n=1 Tax=Galleria mellonella TaxID=7137 RepID=A0ABM3MKQ4_GALME|nr:alpha-tocopherol transfer protein-like [Galleria mellonella]
MPVELEFDYAARTASMDKFSQDDINSLRDWSVKLDKSKYVPKDLTDKQLILFYNACYGDVEKAKTCIEKYYAYKKSASDFFDGRIVDSEELKPLQEVLEFSVLPGRSVAGYDIVFHRLHNTEPSKYNFELGCRLLFMTIDACLTKRGPQPGIIFLFDMRGVKLGHLTRCGLSHLRKFFQFVQEALPVRMKEIHVLNTEALVDKLILLIKPFMDKKFFDMLKFHQKDENLDDFYAKVIPRSSLPSDFGGSLPDTQTLNNQNIETLRALEPYFKAEEAQRFAVLPNKKGDKVEDSFKSLDID